MFTSRKVLSVRRPSPKDCATFLRDWKEGHGKRLGTPDSIVSSYGACTQTMARLFLVPCLSQFGQEGLAERLEGTGLEGALRRFGQDFERLLDSAKLGWAHQAAQALAIASNISSLTSH